MKNVRLILTGGLLCMQVLATESHAQQITLSGVVRDANTYRELQRVNIFIPGTQRGTTSDFSGNFYLTIAQLPDTAVVVFRHIAYEIARIPVAKLKQQKYVDLQPRVIPLKGVEVRGERMEQSEIEQDLPQTMSILRARNFEIRGFTDAGDLLRTDHSIQIDEELSGKKTASIRGGNPDEVVVLYNGVKMNSTFDNIFDLSLIDLEDVARFEIIKGSNTALYGPEAFSGVINIVPKMQQDYTIRFQQRLGTYRSGNWGLHLFQKFNRAHVAYSFKRGGASRGYTTQAGKTDLSNSATHHTFSLNYQLSQPAQDRAGNALGAMFIHTQQDFEDDNVDYQDNLAATNALFSLNYTGGLGPVRNLKFSGSLKRLDQKGLFASENGMIDSDIEEKTLHLSAEKRMNFERVDLLLAYQYQNAILPYTNIRRNLQEQQMGLESGELRRRSYGFVAIVKYHGESGSEFLKTFDLDVSFRHDRLKDDQANAVLRSPANPLQQSTIGLFDDNSWGETMLKFAVDAGGYRNDLAFKSYMTVGLNTKFPTLFQQISSPAFLTRRGEPPNLNPEKSNGLELGVVVTKELGNEKTISGWQISGNFFKNYYENKFRMFGIPGFPFALYDNVPNARIAGFETKSKLFLLRKKVALEVGASRYFITEKAAFPFKADFKATVNLTIDHAGYSFNVLWFREGEQEGWLRNPQDLRFSSVTFEPRMNLDIHFSKSFKLGKIKAFANASARNVLNDQDDGLQGLALRDRRYYVTFGAQY